MSNGSTRDHSRDEGGREAASSQPVLATERSQYGNSQLRRVIMANHTPDFRDLVFKKECKLFIFILIIH